MTSYELKKLLAKEKEEIIDLMREAKRNAIDWKSRRFVYVTEDGILSNGNYWADAYAIIAEFDERSFCVDEYLDDDVPSALDDYDAYSKAKEELISELVEEEDYEGLYQVAVKEAGNYQG